MELKEVLKKIEKYRIWMLLLGIFSVGFSLRYVTHNTLLYDPDSYLWYRLSQYFAGVKAGEVVERGGTLVDTLSYYPAGRNLGNDLLLLPMAIGYSFKLWGFLGLPQTSDAMLRYMFVFGPFVGALKAVAAFFLARELANTRVAAFSALLYSVSTASLTRNTAGDTGQESLGGLLIFVWLFLFIKAVKARALSKQQISFAAASGLTLALANGTWGGNVFYLELITISALLYILFRVLRNHDVAEYAGVALAFAATSLVGKFISFVLVPPRYPLSELTPPYLLNYFALAVALSVLLSYFLETKQNKKVKPVFVLAAAAGVVFLALAASGKLSQLIQEFMKFANSLLSGVKGDITAPTVAYYRESSFADFKNLFGVMLLAAPLGAAYLLYEFYKKDKFEALFIIVWLILGAIAFKWMIRLSFYLALVMPIVTFILVDRIAAYMERSADKKSKAKEDNRVSVAAIGIVVILLLLLNLTPSIAQVSAAKDADRGVVPWQEAGLWLKNNTPQNALLIHWWDYGYYMQTFAERYTIVDGGNSGALVEGGSKVHRNVDVAKFFTSDISSAYQFIKPYNPENLPVYVLVSLEEIPKSGAITHHAGLNKELVELYRKYGVYTEAQYKEIMRKELYRQPIGSMLISSQGDYLSLPEFRNATLVKMLPGREVVLPGNATSKLLFLYSLFKGRANIEVEKIEHYKLVYTNDYVYIYEYVP